VFSDDPNWALAPWRVAKNESGAVILRGPNWCLVQFVGALHQAEAPTKLAVWAEMQAQVEELTGQAGLQILRAILENEVTRRVGPPHRPNPTAGCVRWGKQSGYVVFGGQKIPLERPRVRTREGQEVELESYGQLQQDGKLQRAVRERMVAGLSTRNYRRAVESVVEGYGIEKGSVSRQFVAASCNQLRVLCERRLEDLNLVVLMIDGIHFGGQVLVVALGIAEGGAKHVLGVWQGATENTTVVKGPLEDLVDRGLNRQRRYLVVMDGSKALRAGVERVFAPDRVTSLALALMRYIRLHTSDQVTFSPELSINSFLMIKVLASRETEIIISILPVGDFKVA
jgi:transposase-like protein